jgi:homopolymeric O-antigen transport system ATP-binding protein
VDEVLAVGDEVFQERCFRRVAEMRRQGATIVVISHDLDAVERMCNRALLMRAGQIAADDDAATVARRYRRWAAGQNELTLDPAAPLSPVRITRVDMQADAGMPAFVGRTGYPLTTTVSFAADRPTSELVFEVNYLTHGGNVLMCAQTTAFDGPLDVTARGGEIRFTFDAVGLQPGVYTIAATVSAADGSLLHQFSPPHRLTVEHGKNVRGYFFAPHSWRMDSALRRTGTRP